MDNLFQTSLFAGVTVSPGCISDRYAFKEEV